MMKKVIAFSLIAFLSIFSCKKDKSIARAYTCDNLNPSEITVEINGDLESEFNLETIQEYLEYSECISNCSDTELNCIMNCSNILSSVPSGGVFSVVCHVSNSSKDRISFTLKAGDIFIPSSSGDQPMLNPGDVTIVIDGKKSVSQPIAVYCLASDKSAPSTSSEYSYCNQIDSSACLTDIVDILKTKDMNNVTFTQATKIQGIVWNCTNDSTVDLSYLNSLPNL